MTIEAAPNSEGDLRKALLGRSIVPIEEHMGSDVSIQKEITGDKNLEKSLHDEGYQLVDYKFNPPLAELLGGSPVQKVENMYRDQYGKYIYGLTGKQLGENGVGNRSGAVAFDNLKEGYAGNVFGGDLGWHKLRRYLTEVSPEGDGPSFVSVDSSDSEDGGFIPLNERMGGNTTGNHVVVRHVDHEVIPSDPNSRSQFTNFSECFVVYRNTEGEMIEVPIKYTHSGFFGSWDRGNMTGSVYILPKVVRSSNDDMVYEVIGFHVTGEYLPQDTTNSVEEGEDDSHKVEESLEEKGVKLPFPGNTVEHWKKIGEELRRRDEDTETEDMVVAPVPEDEEDTTGNVFPVVDFIK